MMRWGGSRGNRTGFVMCLVALAWLLAGCAAEVVPGGNLAEANRLYEAGDFAGAAIAYEDLADAGVVDGVLYYNLGNAYFKAGDLGRAILNYRRATRLLPRDADIATNLHLARAQTLDRLEDGKPGAAALLRRSLADWVTLNEAAMAALILWAMLCILGAAAIRWPRVRRRLPYGMAVVAALFAVALLSAGIHVWDRQANPPAVVIAGETEARSGPGADYLLEFTLHAGAEITVLEMRGDWARIGLPGNLQGWVPAEGVEPLSN